MYWKICFECKTDVHGVQSWLVHILEETSRKRKLTFEYLVESSLPSIEVDVLLMG